MASSRDIDVLFQRMIAFASQQEHFPQVGDRARLAGLDAALFASKAQSLGLARETERQRALFGKGSEAHSKAQGRLAGEERFARILADEVRRAELSVPDPRFGYGGDFIVHGFVRDTRRSPQPLHGVRLVNRSGQLAGRPVESDSRGYYRLALQSSALTQLGELFLEVTAPRTGQVVFRSLESLLGEPNRLFFRLLTVSSGGTTGVTRPPTGTKGEGRARSVRKKPAGKAAAKTSGGTAKRRRKGS